jgi:hypothetical protein
MHLMILKHCVIFGNLKLLTALVGGLIRGTVFYFRPYRPVKSKASEEPKFQSSIGATENLRFNGVIDTTITSKTIGTFRPRLHESGV